jgi:hypothetical protein
LNEVQKGSTVSKLNMSFFGRIWSDLFFWHVFVVF